MKELLSQAIAAIAAVLLVGFAACGSDDDEEVSSTPPAITPTAPAAVDDDAGAIRAAFGLDTRPANPTCVAPARPPSASPVKLEPAFPSVPIERPMVMAQPPGNGAQWFVARRNGVIVSFAAASPPAAPAVVADVGAVSSKPIQEDFEGGFLGMAFHPKFPATPRLYVSFTTTGDAGGFGSEVGYLTTTDAGQSFTTYTRILHFARPRLEHNGGTVAFGKDGYLYLSFGDGANDLNAQSKTTFFGKVLRLDVDNVPAGKTYGIPSSNPFASGGGFPEIFAWGFRNPYRLSIDRETGDVWLGDVGDSTFEEVNRVELGGNYGWPCREGAHDRATTAPAACPSKIGLIDPIVEHAHGMPNTRSITGGVVYRGAAMPAMQGKYIYADFIRLELMALSFDPSTGEAKSEVLDPDGLHAGFSSFAEDVNGEIYAVALFQDALFRLVPAAPPAPSTFPERLSATGCVDPNDAKRPAPGLVPFGVNAQLFSDGADKERFLALPDGKTITVGADGDFDLPAGSVLVKTFSLGGRLVETRLFIRHDDAAGWAGYSYEWNDAQSDAVLLVSSKTKPVGDRTWTFPSRSDCVRCHTATAGGTLGLELGQLNGEHMYPSTKRVANQLATLDHIGMFATPLGRPAAEIVAYPTPSGAGPAEPRARAYLHANCAGCHRPGGGSARSTMDLRFGASLKETNTCGVASMLDDLGVAAAKLITPGQPATSLLSLRIHATDAKRMPPLGRRLVDEGGAALIDEWIRSTPACP